MALDENIFQLRLEKLKQIEALGQPLYPSKYAPRKPRQNKMP